MRRGGPYYGPGCSWADVPPQLEPGRLLQRMLPFLRIEQPTLAAAGPRNPLGLSNSVERQAG